MRRNGLLIGVMEGRMPGTSNRLLVSISKGVVQAGYAYEC